MDHMAQSPARRSATHRGARDACSWLGAAREYMLSHLSLVVKRYMYIGTKGDREKQKKRVARSKRTDGTTHTDKTA